MSKTNIDRFNMLVSPADMTLLLKSRLKDEGEDIMEVMLRFIAQADLHTQFFAFMDGIDLPLEHKHPEPGSQHEIYMPGYNEYVKATVSHTIKVDFPIKGDTDTRYYENAEEFWAAVDNMQPEAIDIVFPEFPNSIETVFITGENDQYTYFANFKGVNKHALKSEFWDMHATAKKLKQERTKGENIFGATAARDACQPELREGKTVKIWWTKYEGDELEEHDCTITSIVEDGDVAYIYYEVSAFQGVLAEQEFIKILVK